MSDKKLDKKNPFDWQKCINRYDIESTVKFVMHSVYVYCDFTQESPVCFPSQERIAAETNLSKRTVIRSLDKASNLGLISVIKGRAKDGKWGSNSYKMHWPESLNLSNNGFDYEKHPKNQVTLCHPVDENINKNQQKTANRVTLCPSKGVQPSDSVSLGKPKIGPAECHSVHHRVTLCHPNKPINKPNKEKEVIYNILGCQNVTRSNNEHKLINIKENTEKEKSVNNKNTEKSNEENCNKEQEDSFSLIWDSDSFKDSVPMGCRVNKSQVFSLVVEQSNKSGETIEFILGCVENFYLSKYVQDIIKENQQKGNPESKFIKHVKTVIEDEIYKDFENRETKNQNKKSLGSFGSFLRVSDNEFDIHLNSYKSNGNWNYGRLGPIPHGKYVEGYNSLSKEQHDKILPICKSWKKKSEASRKKLLKSLTK